MIDVGDMETEAYDFFYEDLHKRFKLHDGGVEGKPRHKKRERRNSSSTIKKFEVPTHVNEDDHDGATMTAMSSNSSVASARCGGWKPGVTAF